jgi:hypothetical protein
MVASVAERHFSPGEVEALIPVLTEIMQAIMQSHAEAGEVRERIREEQTRVAMSGGAVIDRERWQADARRAEQLKAEIERGLKRIAGLGGVPKDLTLGLVDFPHVRAGREVYLCWKHGEREIRYWHGVDEGYAGRQPL